MLALMYACIYCIFARGLIPFPAPLPWIALGGRSKGTTKYEVATTEPEPLFDSKNGEMAMDLTPPLRLWFLQETPSFRTL